MHSNFTHRKGSYKTAEKNTIVYYANCKLALQLYSLNKVEADRRRRAPRLPIHDSRRQTAHAYHPSSHWRLDRLLSWDIFPIKKLFAWVSSSATSSNV